MPAAKLVIHEMPRTFNPLCAATITSGTVDIPTASAPIVRDKQSFKALIKEVLVLL